MTVSLCADMIEAHRTWLTMTCSERTEGDACELLYRADADLADMQRAAGDVPGGLAAAWPEELVAWLARGRGPDRRAPGGHAGRWSPQTRYTYRGHLRRFYKWAVATGWMTYDPSAGLPAPKVHEAVPRPATDAQVAYVVRHAADPHWLHCVLAAYAGFRPSDIANARREHFTLELMELDGVLVETPTIRVRGKGDKPSILPCDPLIWEAVRDLPAGPIARRSNGSIDGLTAQHITNDAWYYLHRRLHLDVSLRSFRSWYATTMLERYRDHRVVQELMRHASLSTLQRYAAVTAARKRAAVLTLPSFGGRGAAGGAGGDPRRAAAAP